MWRYVGCRFSGIPRDPTAGATSSHYIPRLGPANFLLRNHSLRRTAAATVFRSRMSSAVRETPLRSTDGLSETLSLSPSLSHSVRQISLLMSARSCGGGGGGGGETLCHSREALISLSPPRASSAVQRLIARQLQAVQARAIRRPIYCTMGERGRERESSADYWHRHHHHPAPCGSY